MVSIADWASHIRYSTLLKLYAGTTLLMISTVAASEEELPITPDKTETFCQNWVAASQFQPLLPATWRALKEKPSLTIVALGSSATEGAGPDLQDDSYPASISRTLLNSLPDYKVVILNQGIGSQTAHEMLQRMDEDVIAYEPALLIWDTVITDALRDVGEDNLIRVLKKGISKARNAGIDIMLMDLQWLPRENRYPHYDHYRRAFRKAATELQVPIVPRYELMKAMAQSGLFTQEHQIGTDVLALTEATNQCLATLISKVISSEIQE